MQHLPRRRLVPAGEREDAPVSHLQALKGRTPIAQDEALGNAINQKVSPEGAV